MKNQLPVFMKHAFDTNHQYQKLDEIRKTLSFNEVTIIIDFSENYYCKYATEIQSMHFGASKKQVSLHTGVFFYKDLQEQPQCVSFATVSENLRHDAFAIWAHLDPIFNLVFRVVPGMHTIHFQSDGPSTQYKNRNNLYLFWSKCKSLGLRAASWNFTTPGHGKSFADGTGGSIKAMCDRAVCHGKDITSARDIVDLVSSQEDGKIRIFEVHGAQIMDVQKAVLEYMQPIPKIKSLFQLVWNGTEPESLYLNNLSCTECILRPPSTHFASTPMKFSFSSPEDSNVDRGLARGRGRGRGGGRGRSGRGRGGRGRGRGTCRGKV